MNNPPIDPFEFRSEDRPLECTGCSKPIAVRYTEVVGNSITHTVMCADCPQLERRLHGIPSREGIEALGSGAAGLCCGGCGTTLAEVRAGSLLGCSACYDVFEDVIIMELTTAKAIGNKWKTVKKGVSLNLGRAPGEMKEISPSIKLMALNEALTETLQREDYEQAAWLRDQIKEITEHSDDNRPKK